MDKVYATCRPSSMDDLQFGSVCHALSKPAFWVHAISTIPSAFRLKNFRRTSTDHARGRLQKGMPK